MDPSTVVFSPAYGKDYASRAEVVAALNGGKDFRAHFSGGQSTYSSIRDIDDGQLEVRYQKRSLSCIIYIGSHRAS